jgi:transcriptional regulator with PAS, ATPase and Fis domain
MSRLRRQSVESFAHMTTPSPYEIREKASAASGGRDGASSPEFDSGRFVVGDPRMLQVFELARRLGDVDTSVLVQGETGVGKEVVAEHIHRSSQRASGPFVRLNCAALPMSLLENELFGSVRGAFTGAERNRLGYLESAHGGTLFLDEIGELPLTAQVKLLNVLENREVRRLGTTGGRRIDVRVVSATHRDLPSAIEHGTFRADFFYRLSAFTLTVPPLRERPLDVRLLAEKFVRDCARREGRPVPVLDASTLSALVRHPWPGNVRELKNVIEHAIVVADENRIFPDDLPASLGV